MNNFTDLLDDYLTARDYYKQNRSLSAQEYLQAAGKALNELMEQAMGEKK